ncbi:leucyl aminopeptidase [Patescibacteria group bacterium]|nr:leucyl aminopeptidase [Patescibacteria group bacterium]MBU1034913.1 leucyl aminopeptidase [Patescibacteria group bacterium]MBU1629658.1 leucyl aminopeptidase [Patescibacteria group bacterium]MBU1908314.1 leucyl aminopeptidase [Patescibacteria group bacterium]
MQIKLEKAGLLDFGCDLLVVYSFEDSDGQNNEIGVLDAALEGAMNKLMRQSGFKGQTGQVLVFPTFGKIKARQVAIMGLGKVKDFNTDLIRKIGGRAVQIAETQRAKNLTIFLLGVNLEGFSPQLCAQALTEGALLAAHKFHLYKGRKHNSRDINKLEAFTILLKDGRILKTAQNGVERGGVLAEGVLLARDLVNAPSSDMTPHQMAAEAKKLALRGSGITCKLLDQNAMHRLGMNAALAVARGATHPPVGVHLVYRPTSGAKRQKSVAIVGKAVTFDSGGLSLKPAKSMETMKIDMAGAASVIGLFKTLAALKPKVAVHGIFLAVENMPSGSAYRPGDVVKTMDGTTVEVLNTDAEGRLTLADSLTYAIKQKPDVLIDLATLTGACVTALGEDIAGLLANDDALSDKILNAAKLSGEELWRLPLRSVYGEQIKSKIADIKNIAGGSGGGAITAALFLQNFVGNTPWAHLDIAGPSYTEKETRPDLPFGASGYGVRLLAEFLKDI